jgi:molybdate/tungstate transport system substrate-binding protein
MRIFYIIVGILLFLSLFFGGCASQKRAEEKVIIFHAGSLSIPMKIITEQYMKENPGVKIQMESAGSVACARKITELNQPCDIMASADYQIIDRMLIPDYSKWSVHFAANSMVIAYTEKSGRGNEIDQDNWIDILLDPKIYYGRSDPDSDPCGYRTLLTLQLAERYYNRDGITSLFSAKDRNMIRPKEVDLLALLETNAIDYIFIYKSVAMQHSLKYLELPAEVDLSLPQLDELYSSVSVEIRGSSPGELMTIAGSSMVYGVTLLNNAPNSERAIDFLEYMLGEPGQRVIKEMGQELKTPPYTKNLQLLPELLRPLCIDDSE